MKTTLFHLTHYHRPWQFLRQAQTMKLGSPIYRRTTTGKTALRSLDAAIPVDYRRILALLEGQTHIDVIRGCLRRYSDALIEDWLAELMEIGFVEAVDADDTQSVSLAEILNSGVAFRILGELPDERRFFEVEAREANAVLLRKRAYLATGRLRNRKPLSKIAAQCVVLLVEDDPDQAALADLRVSMAGYGLRLARGRREMVKDLVTQSTPDVVLLDVMLPDGNGFDILASMRRHPNYSLVPVILLTAMTSADDIQRGLELGADGYVTKPYSKSLLTETLREVLRHA